MSLAEQLDKHAWELLNLTPEEKGHEQMLLRRAISAACYALFHQLVSDAAALLAPNVPEKTNHRIQRWFDHAEMKRICSRFLPAKLDQPFLGLLGTTASSDLQLVARTFIELQEARHRADYDLGFMPRRDDVDQLVENGFQAAAIWTRIRTSAEANIFILSLLLWKNWDDKTRP